MAEKPWDMLPRCTNGGKVGYRSAAKARQAIGRHSGRRPKLHVYRCPACEHWHITTWAQDPESWERRRSA